MKFIYSVALAITALMLSTTPVWSASPVSESRPIDGRVTKIVLDSVIQLKVRQGATASLMIFADSEFIKKVMTEQSGETLRISSETHGFNFGNQRELRVEISLPALVKLDSQGVGSTVISGFSGNALDIELGGAGQIQVNDSRYKNLKARLTGVGNMVIDARDAESLDLRMPGAGTVTVSGAVKKLDVTLSGVGSLSAKELTAAKANVNLSGLGSATLTVKEDANINLSGLGSATVFGNPTQRNANTSGLGKVSFR